MNVLGMGPMEVLLIVVLALIVFGPSKLPEIMGSVGKAINDFRRATSDLSDEFNRTIQAELKETKSVVDETRATMRDAHQSVNSAIAGTPAPTRTAVPETVPAAGLPGSNGATPAEPPNGAVPASASTATAQPPLADTTQWSWETSAPPAQKPSTAEAPSESQRASAETPPAPPSEPPAPKPTKPSTNDELAPPY